jgi:hypothetical protein
LFHFQDFQSGDPFDEFTNQFGMSYVGDGYAMALSPNSPPVTLRRSLAAQLLVEADVTPAAGGVTIRLESEDFSTVYEAMLDGSGIFSLTHNGIMLGSATAVPAPRYHVRLSVLNGQVRLNVNGMDIVSQTDTVSTSPFWVTFAPSPVNEVLVDNLAVWVAGVSTIDAPLVAAIAPIGGARRFVNIPAIYDSAFNAAASPQEGFLAGFNGELRIVNRHAYEAIVPLESINSSSVITLWDVDFSPDGNRVVVECIINDSNPGFQHDICVYDISQSNQNTGFAVHRDANYDYDAIFVDDNHIGFNRDYSNPQQATQLLIYELIGSNGISATPIAIFNNCDNPEVAGRFIICVDPSTTTRGMFAIDSADYTLPVIPLNIGGSYEIEATMVGSTLHIAAINSSGNQFANTFQHYQFQVNNRTFTLSSSDLIQPFNGCASEGDRIVGLEWTASGSQLVLAQEFDISFDRDYQLWMLPLTVSNPPCPVAITGIEEYSIYGMASGFSTLFDTDDELTATAQAQPTATPTIDPTICTSRQLGTVNLRTQPNFNESAPRQLTDGTVRFVGRYVLGDDIWLRVNGYYAAGSSTLDTTAVGWIHLSAFGGVEPFGSGSILSLPLLDQSGAPVPTPTPNPNMTPTASATPPVSASPVCEDALSNQPVRLRSGPTTSDSEILYVESYTPVDIYWSTDNGSEYNSSRVWYYISLNYGVPAERYFGWMHSTVIDARTCPPIITITPSPTLTPTPSNTPPPDLSSVFPLPMIAPDSAHPVRLSDCLNLTYGIPSVDINPVGLSGNFAVQTPARSAVVIVDRDGGGNPGVFVSIRVDMQDVPQIIRDRLATMNEVPGIEGFGNITESTGSLHIAYSHLEEGSIPSNIEPSVTSNGIPSESYISTNTYLGESGDTGAAYGSHLDVAVYHVQDIGAFANALMFESFENPFFRNPLHRYNSDAFWTIWDATTRGPSLYFGELTLVNPLVLWPSLQEGTLCGFYGSVAPE